MFQRTVVTNLRNREELFRVLALGESTNLPVLLIGEPGTAKTQGALDFVGSGKSYIIQTSMGTRPNDIRGVVDMNAYINDKTYRTISPITEADCIIVDEIDKTNDSVRDMLLSVMREKRLFLGSEGSKQCKWKLFIGCCNTQPTVSAFWDRFVIRFDVDRMPPEMVLDLLHLKRTSINYPILNTELVNIVLNKEQTQVLEAIVSCGYRLLTDRSITYLPKLLVAVANIWELKDPAEAGVKVASLMNPLIVPMLYKKLGLNIPPPLMAVPVEGD